jgi:hypothetical protein
MYEDLIKAYRVVQASVWSYRYKGIDALVLKVYGVDFFLEK